MCAYVTLKTVHFTTIVVAVQLSIRTLQESVQQGMPIRTRCMALRCAAPLGERGALLLQGRLPNMV